MIDDYNIHHSCQLFRNVQDSPGFRLIKNVFEKNESLPHCTNLRDFKTTRLRDKDTTTTRLQDVTTRLQDITRRRKLLVTFT